MVDTARSTLLYVLVVGLIAYVAFLVAQATWLFATEKGVAPMVLPNTSQQQVEQVKDRAVSIPGFQLFGRFGAKPVVVKEEKPKEAPKTRLRLRLQGVFTAERSEDSGAIIEELGKKSAYYRVGDTIPGNAKLEEVYPDRVLLRRSGKLETLLFEEKKSSGKTTIAKTNKPDRPVKKTAKKEKELIKSPEQFMEVATQRLAQNPEAALTSVGLAEAQDGSGYVYNGNNPMLAGLNLKKGDIIRSVNGHNLGDIQKDKELLQSLYEQGSLEVEVMRNGTSFYVNYPLR